MPIKTDNLKVAIVHDSLMEYGGAERLVGRIYSLFPHADLYTLCADFKVKRLLAIRSIYTSFIDHTPLKYRHSLVQLFAPVAWRLFDLNDYDLVITSSSFAFANTVKAKGIKINYIHTIPRNIFGIDKKWGTQKFLPFTGLYRKIYLNSISDKDLNLTNSDYTRLRIFHYTGIDPVVIYPPINLPKKNITKDRRPYYISVSRLDLNKNLDLVISVFNKLKLPLLIIGTGKEEKRLRRLAGPTIEFLGFIDDSKLRKIYSEAKAFIFAADAEDFGMAPVEAMAYGCPVICFAAGGLRETVQNNISGITYKVNNERHLANAIRRFRNRTFNDNEVKRSAYQYSESQFSRNIKACFRHYISSREKRSGQKLVFLFLTGQGGETNNIQLQIRLLSQSMNAIPCPIDPPLSLSNGSAHLKLLRYYSRLIVDSLRIVLPKLSARDDRPIIFTSILPVLPFLYLFKKLFHLKIVYLFNGVKHLTLKKELELSKGQFSGYCYILPVYLCISWLEHLGLSIVDKIVLPSKLSRAPFETFYGQYRKKYSYIPNTFDDIYKPSREYSFRHPKKRICFTGRLTPEKGALEIIQAFVKLPADKYLLNLYCLPGHDKTYLAKCEELIKHRDNIKLSYNVDTKHLAKFLRNQDLTILPSRAELLSLSFLESIASGIPMLITNVGEHRSLVGQIHPKLVLKNRDPEEIIKKINWYFSLPEIKKEKIRNNCLSVADKFSLVRHKKEIIKLIYSLIDEPTGI